MAPTRQRVARAVASVAGIGAAPVAPGTVASLAAVAMGWPLLAAGHAVLGLATLAVSGIGYLACQHSGAADRDPGWIVIDEVAGQFLALAALPRPGLVGAAAAFGLFRLFDIVKPWPVGRIDQRRDALGIMADDLAAGAMAALGLAALSLVLPGGWERWAG